jgi:hypothetical protein
MYDAPMTTTWLAADLEKRWMERFVLRYSLVWIGVVTALITTHAFARFGDAGHLAIGLGLSAPLWVVPLFAGPPSERERPFFERHSTRFNLWIGLFSLLQVYFGSGLFFDVLGMEYHFPVRLVLNRTPVFLYFLTITYFSTYYVVMSVIWRAFLSLRPNAPHLLRFAVLCVIGFAVAFAETSSMATPLMRDYFLYRDKRFALEFGSMVYGSIFVLSLPFVFRLDEDATRPKPRLSALAFEVLAVNMLALIAYEGWTAVLR